MSGEALYERYKEALKRGHVASLRGRIDEALAAYAEAARIAPERSTPHTSAGTALMRRKRPADALRQYEAALRVGPRDEAALLGRAQALLALDRRADAADAFDALAELRGSNGNLADAVEAARRGLELAEGRYRRRTLETLIEQLRASEPGEPGRVALERALRVLDGPALPSRPPVARALRAAPAPQAEIAAPVGEVAVDLDAAAESTGAGAEVQAAPEPQAAPEAGPVPETAPLAGPEAESESVREAALVAESESVPESVPEAEPESAPEAAPVEPVIPRVLDRALPEHVDLEALTRDAELALDSGDPSSPERYLDLAAASLRGGRINAALDACYQALSFDPDDTGVHLALVQLYDREGWTTLATEKLDLLARLASHGDDPGRAARIAAARADRG